MMLINAMLMPKQAAPAEDADTQSVNYQLYVKDLTQRIMLRNELWRAGLSDFWTQLERSAKEQEEEDQEDAAQIDGQSNSSNPGLNHRTGTTRQTKKQHFNNKNKNFTSLTALLATFKQNRKEDNEDFLTLHEDNVKENFEELEDIWRYVTCSLIKESPSIKESITSILHNFMCVRDDIQIPFFKLFDEVTGQIVYNLEEG